MDVPGFCFVAQKFIDEDYAYVQTKRAFSFCDELVFHTVQSFNSLTANKLVDDTLLRHSMTKHGSRSRLLVLVLA